MFCMQCGEKLPDHAKFCFKCGAKIDGSQPAAAPEPDISAGNTVAPSSPAAVKPGAAKTVSSDSAQLNDAFALEELFANLDPVVCHTEYYFLKGGNPMLGGFSMAVNRDKVLRHVSHFPDDDYIITDENGENERRLDIHIRLRKAEYKYLMGFNSNGVWFMVRSQINDRFLNVKFLCADVVGGRIIEYPIEHQHGTITDVYIFEDEICYINNTSEGLQYLHRLTPGSNVLLFETQKEESVFRLSANAERIAWGFVSKRDVKTFWRWHFYDKTLRRMLQLTVPPNKDKTWMPLVEIVAVDLVKNTMYTSLTENEAAHFDVPEWSVAVRKIEDPKEFGILSYKGGQSAVWKVDRGLPDYYFDGAVFYYVPNSAELDRFDRFGTKFALGKTGTGACQNFLVTEKWLYVNYDAHDMVRLPKQFTAYRGLAADNPESFFIFGKGKDFRM